MSTVQYAMEYLLTGSIVVLGILICLCLVRAIKGPRIADRIVAVNMIGTLTIIIICILAVYLKESYLVDVAIVYAMISFLAVIVLCKVYTGVYLENKKKEEDR
ncbi:MAG: monovalent cation/H+ antiporter complex subunit F [bacterium]|nr:monovalent cation/H+ antiporter complex subunit F [bacterium]